MCRAALRAGYAQPRCVGTGHRRLRQDSDEPVGIVLQLATPKRCANAEPAHPAENYVAMRAKMSGM